MTTTQSTEPILDFDGLAAFAPGLYFADAYRLSFRDEDGNWRWRVGDVSAYVDAHADAYVGASAYEESE